MMRSRDTGPLCLAFLLAFVLSPVRPQSSVERPAAALPHLKNILGEYVAGNDRLTVLERDGSLHVTRKGGHPVRLREAGFRDFIYRDPRTGDQTAVTFDGKPGARPAFLTWGRVRYTRTPFSGEDGNTFTITPLYGQEELRRRSHRASPPDEDGTFRRSDLVELKSLDSTILYDIRYASTNNFMRQRFYTLERAYLQRPAAEALVKAHTWLARFGYGLLIHDAYRPWTVTKMFWDATPHDMKEFVANPSRGSRHNRGCAVDVTLYDLKTGTPIEMVSGYDEFSDRSHPDYPGGTSLQRWHRELLRDAFEREGFAVYYAEWWHFDYKSWRGYRIEDKTFEELDNGNR